MLSRLFRSNGICLATQRVRQMATVEANAINLITSKAGKSTPATLDRATFTIRVRIFDTTIKYCIKLS